MTDDGQASPGVLSLLFGLSARVTRKAYLTAGLALMALKYALDAVAVYLASGRLLDPLRFVSPLWNSRIPSGPEAFTAQVDVDAALVAMAAWALVFMWVGVSMSIRRAVDAGKSGWLGLLFMVPLLNLVVMAALAALPSSERGEWTPPHLGPHRDPDGQERIDAKVPFELQSALLGVALSCGLGLGMLGVSVYLLDSYGSALFFLTPFTMGASAAFLFNRRAPQTMGKTITVSLTSVLVTGLAMILLALEGVTCIVMAAPVASVIATLGAVVGRALAAQAGSSQAHAAAVLLVLPGFAGAEAALTEPPVFEVISTIEIDATPDQVWANVIGFSELPQPRRKLFDMGIAYPMRARIDGAGVGAVRHCEFSTGPFVEPITRWEPGERLSFDVAAQPPAMEETSPWADVYPPHLDDSIRSRRGEFRLVALPGGRTRLEGSTWYELKMGPTGYWRFWSDLMIHAIHHRVLDHVKALSERDAAAAR